MDKLAKSGIILENHYVQPICTPTRSALMTGYYPIHTGRQVIFLLIYEGTIRVIVFYLDFSFVASRTKGSLHKLYNNA